MPGYLSMSTCQESQLHGLVQPGRSKSSQRCYMCQKRMTIGFYWSPNDQVLWHPVGFVLLFLLHGGTNAAFDFLCKVIYRAIILESGLVGWRPISFPIELVNSGRAISSVSFWVPDANALLLQGQCMCDWPFPRQEEVVLASVVSAECQLFPLQALASYKVAVTTNRRSVGPKVNLFAWFAFLRGRVDPM